MMACATMAISFFCLFNVPVSHASNPPALPQVNVNVSMPNTSGYATETVCAQGCQFTTLHDAVNAASCGTVITLQAGQTFTEDQYNLPAKPCDESHWIIIESSALSQLPPSGVRIGPQYAQYMPTVLSGNSDSIISNYGRAGGINHYRFIGINFQFSSNDNNSTFALYLGNGQVSDTSTRIIIDRCMIQGQAAYSSHEGIILGASNSAVVDSYIAEIHSLDDGDTNAILVPGRGEAGYLFQNNYLEAAGENILFGGGGTGNVYDVTLEHNYFYKNPAWNWNSPGYGGVRWIVKNLLEFKIGTRVLVDSNIFQNTWSDAQSSAIVFTPRSSQNPGALDDDITFRNNIIQHAPAAFNSAAWDGYDTNWQYSTMGVEINRIAVYNNIFDDIGGTNVCCGAYSMVFTTYDGPVDVHIYHNTMVSTVDPAANLGGANAGLPLGSGFQLNDNIIFGAGTDTTSLNNAFTDWTSNNNAVVGPYASSTYPASTIVLANAASIGFVNYNNGSGGDYHLSPTSPLHNAASDGTDIGANVDTVLADTAGVINGNGSPVIIVSNPPIISSISANPSQSSVTITWTTDKAANSQVQYGTTASYGLSSPVSDSGGVTSHSVTLSGLTANTVYHFSVKSIDSSGDLASSPDQTFTTQAAPPFISSFNANPTTLTSGSSTILSWVVSGASSVLITNPNGFQYQSTVLSGSTTNAPLSSTTYTLKASNALNVSVSASVAVSVSPATISGSSVYLSASTIDFGTIAVGSASPSQHISLFNNSQNTLPSVSVSITGDYSIVTDSCVPVPNSGWNGQIASMSHCDIYLTFSPSTSGTRSGTLTVSEPGVASSPQIVSLTGVGSSITVIPPVVPSGGGSGGGGSVPTKVSLTAPTGLIATPISASSISLTWSPSTGATITGYRIWRSGYYLGYAPSTSFTDTNLAPNTTYSYSISAYDAASDVSPQSAAVSGTTLARSQTPVTPPVTAPVVYPKPSTPTVPSSPTGTGSTPSSVTVGSLTANLSYGSSGSQVASLQKFLAQYPSIYPSGLVTGFFGNLTRQAIINFQAGYGIATSIEYGIVGPVTRAKINAIIASGSLAGTISPTAGQATLEAELQADLALLQKLEQLLAQLQGK